jgi:Trk K+ transport system NAD-binding subunit
MQDVQTFAMSIDDSNAAAEFLGKNTSNLHLPDASVLAVIRREGKIIDRDQETAIEKGDELIAIAQGDAIEEIQNKYLEK